MEIVNLHSDYHSHTFIFSDGANTIDEIVIFAGHAGLKELAITEHSRSHLMAAGIEKKTSGSNILRWQNVHNDVRVLFGVEADILNEDGDVDFQPYSRGEEFVVLSLHGAVYKGDLRKVSQAYLKAIERYSERIGCLGHICASSTSEHLDLGLVLEAANEFGIAPELNCANLYFGKTDLRKLDFLLKSSPRIYVNSDSHTLWDMLNLRKHGFEYLRAQGFIS